MSMELRHRQPELGGRHSTIGQETPAKRRITPCSSNDTRAVLGHPLLLCETVELLDGRAGVQSAIVENSLDRLDSPLDGGGTLEGLLGVGYVHHFLRSR